MFLHRLKHGRFYNSIMIVFHIILRSLTLIDLFLFREEMLRVIKSFLVISWIAYRVILKIP